MKATARCWNNGVLHGDLGDLFFMLLKMKQNTSCKGCSSTETEESVHGDHSLAWTRPAEWRNDGLVIANKATLKRVLKLVVTLTTMKINPICCVERLWT